MIYLFTALYCEADIFIKQFHLKKNLANTQFQEFYNEVGSLRLTVTGVGEIAAAAAVGSVCTEHKPGAEDILLNVGTCAHTQGETGIFLCNKIRERATGKTFYPDILYRHNFREEAIVTGMQPWNSREVIPEELLYDMEAAAVYQAGSYFFGPHQMMFLKVVSDEGATKEVTKDMVERLMETYQDILCEFIGQLQRRMQRNSTEKTDCLPQAGDALQGRNALQERDAPQERETLLERLCTDMHCSKVMRDSLEQHIRYLALSGIEYGPVIQEMYREGLLPCKDKREGKLRFEELKRRLL